MRHVPPILDSGKVRFNKCVKIDECSEVGEGVVEEGEEVFSCDKCEAIFHNYNNYRTHEVLHSMEGKNYVEEECKEEMDFINESRIQAAEDDEDKNTFNNYEEIEAMESSSARMSGDSIKQPETVATNDDVPASGIILWKPVESNISNTSESNTKSAITPETNSGRLPLCQNSYNCTFPVDRELSVDSRTSQNCSSSERASQSCSSSERASQNCSSDSRTSQSCSSSERASQSHSSNDSQSEELSQDRDNKTLLDTNVHEKVAVSAL